ncbi:J domain-containing protein CG6693 [Drosophila grimshawi]|uniref:GH18109 n=1 Tax=Drosophila grimshawi TaxID=7222 RepID=B4JGY9_DROGR|nr:J domain-containing protein CG6693 [Drosophila grimshawi]EDV93767.1 GH18109 [Drosophila grimshawi]
MTTLELCEKYFETRDVYKLMGIVKDAKEKEIKKAYHKLSLLVHPDRVPEAQKEESTEKFKVLSKIYQVLTDPAKRALYDEQAIIDDDDEGKLTNWLDLWSKIFKPLTVEDISNYEKEYVGSELERTDIKKAYLGGKGCMNYIMNHVPFMKVEDEPRFQEIVAAMIAANDVPEYKIFTEEPAAKRTKRHKKYARESKEAHIIKERIQRRQQKDDEEAATASGGNLEHLILARKNQRESNYNSLMDRLLEKYAGEDDSDIVDFSAALDKTKKKRKPKHAQNPTKLNGVKKGRVEKPKA